MGNASRQPKELGFEVPLVINEAPEHCFQKPAPEGGPDEREDLLEHLGEGGSNGIHCLPGAAQAKREENNLKRLELRRQTKRRQRSQREAAAFDHEASFVEPERQQKAAGGSSSEPLLLAVRKGDLPAVEEALSSSASCVDTRDRHRQTPLFWAVTAPDLALLRLLLDAQASPLSANLHGYTPMMRALRHGCVEAAEELFRRKADVSSQDKFGYTCLQVAASAGQAEAVEWLLQCPGAGEQVFQHDTAGGSALLAAVRGGHSYICQVLLDAGAPPDGADEAGRSPLLHAFLKNDLDVALRLIASGADVNAEDEDGHSVLLSLTRSLLKHASRREDMLCCVAVALEARANPEATDERGCTCLLLGARAGDATLCALLAAYSADVLVVDHGGNTALSYARKKGFTQVSRVLADFGLMRGTGRRDDLDRLLLRASYYGNAEACSRLMERGASSSTRSPAGQTLKEVAKRQGQPAVVRVLKDQERADARQAEAAEDIDADGQVEVQRLLALCLEDLRRLGCGAADVQAAARSSDAGGIIRAATAIGRAAKGALPEESSVTASLLTACTEHWRDVAMEHAHSELRALRARARRGALEALGEAVLAWACLDWEGGERLQEKLQRVMAEGVHKIRTVEVSAFEGAVKYTKKLEALQKEEIDATLRLVSSLSIVFAEEAEIKETVPQDLPLECNPDLALKVPLATEKLKATARMYVQKAELCKKAFEEARANSKRACRKLPEAVPTLSGCMALLRNLRKAFFVRSKSCAALEAELRKRYGGACGPRKVSKRRSSRAGGG